MANGFSSFKQDHHYASGILLATVGVVGVIGALTGNLANMLAALWVPDILFTAKGGQAAHKATGADIGVMSALGPLGVGIADATGQGNLIIKTLEGPLGWALP